MEIALVLAIIAVIFIVRTFKIVPQQNAWVSSAWASTTAR
jgi:regulator of protease activity HflC (stomatin/prohibitin superfamily)